MQNQQRTLQKRDHLWQIVVMEKEKIREEKLMISKCLFLQSRYEY